MNPRGLPTAALCLSREKGGAGVHDGLFWDWRRRVLGLGLRARPGEEIGASAVLCTSCLEHRRLGAVVVTPVLVSSQSCRAWGSCPKP